MRPITKKELCAALGLVSRKGKCYYHILRRDYLTDQVLEKAGIDYDYYHGRSIFPVNITRIFLEECDLLPADVWPIGA